MVNPATGYLARRVLLRGAAASAMALAMPTAHAAATAEVKIDNFTFSPPMLTVPKGAQVTWVNQDDIPHSIVLPALNVRSHALDTDQQFTCRFEKSGSYNYMCGLHPHMKGRIVVNA